MKIAIDGTAASGKGTLGKRLSKILKLPYLDTGLLYRKTAFMYINSKNPFTEDIAVDISELDKVLEKINFEKLDAEMLKDDLYGTFASKIGKLNKVRDKLKIIQIKYVKEMLKKKGGCILDGRDIGTEIMPNADYKFYVDASIEVRAKRRFDQLSSKQKSLDFNKILSDLKKRDSSDKSRINSPLIVAKESILIDSGLLNPLEVETKALSYIKKS